MNTPMFRTTAGQEPGDQDQDRLLAGWSDRKVAQPPSRRREPLTRTRASDSIYADDDVLLLDNVPI